MGIADRLSALGRGAAQSATGGWVDEVYPKILDAIPFDDKTGIPREYAGGSAEGQYKNEYRADDAEAARKYPVNYGTGALVGAVPAAVATAPLGVPGMVGLGAAQAAGSSENSGAALARDAVRGGALGGALGAAGNVAQAAAPAAKAALDKLRQGPPGGFAPQPAMARAGTGAVRLAPAPTAVPSGPQINKVQVFDPSKFEKGFDRFGEARHGVEPRRASPPPRPTTADLSEVMAETPEQEALAALRRMDRPSVPPVDYKNASAPKLDKIATEKVKYRDPKTGELGEEVDTIVRPKKVEQTSGSVSKSAAPPGKSGSARERAAARKAAQKPAPEQSAQIVPIKQAAPAPRPELTAANKPLVGPKQLSDDRILELARQTPESAPQPRAEMSPEQMESAKQALRDQFRKTASGGNVVNLDDGSLQVADNPFIAGTVREYQQNAKAALAAGDEDAAAWFKDKIESLLAAGGE